MSFNWEDYVDLARQMNTTAGLGSEEARFRTVVSRAYYGVFCCSRNFLRDKEGVAVPSTGEAHIFVRDQLVSSGNKSRRDLGNTLHRLRLNRNDGDYKDNVRGLPQMAAASLIQASKALALLAKI